MSQEKITRFRRRFDSLYWQQFLLTAGMVLLTLLLLGVSFYALSYNDTVSERRSEMRQHAELIANMSGDYLASDGQTASPSLQNLIALAAGLTKADFLLCNDQGYALLTSDQRLGGQVVSVPQEIQDAVFGDKGFYQGRSSIGGAYDIRQFVVAVPVTQEDGGTVGMVLAVMDARSLMSMWRSFIGLFFMTSAIILLISFVASSLTSMRQIQPIREMVQATRSYAAGNFDVRMQDTGRSDEIGELAASFNNMADSLAETEHQRSEFIANISHELKTPMTTIAGYTDGILDGTIPPEKERKYLQIISDESRRLSRLVRRMLDISQIQSQQDMKKEDFDLCESMRLALLSMEQKITDRGLDVEADIPEDSVMVQGVNDLITQVIYNLLENAAKFAAPGSTLYLGLTETGGDKAVFEEVKPLAESMGHPVYTGGPASGSITKLVNNMVAGAYLSAIAEGYAFAAKAGIDLQTTFDATRCGFAGGPLYDNKVPKIIHRDYEPGARIAVHLKDIHNAKHFAHKLGVDTPVTDVTMQIMEWMGDNGYIDIDQAGMVKYFEAKMDVKVGSEDK